MYCSKCGNKIEDSNKFCSKCGTQINSKITIQKEKQPTKKNKINVFNAIAIGPIGLLLFMVFFYVFIACIEVGNSSDGSVSGLYVIFGIPMGLIIACTPVFITFGIYIFNSFKSKTILTVLSIVFGVISLLLIKFFQGSFTSSYEHNEIFFYLCIVLVGISSVLSIIGLLTKKEIK